MDRKNFWSFCFKRKRDNGSVNLAYIITDECVNCGICIEYCPILAIEEGEMQVAISESCVQCGACVQICPVQAIIKK